MHGLSDGIDTQKKERLFTLLAHFTSLRAVEIAIRVLAVM